MVTKKQKELVLFQERQRPSFTPAHTTRSRLVPVNGAEPIALPAEDNTPEGIRALLSANQYFREHPWPAPFDRTTHRLHHGDARDLSWIPDASIHLVVTSPPYWTLKEYPAH